jgi:hypothetical protein
MGSMQEGIPPLAQTPNARSITMPSKDLTDFLVEFSIVLHKRVMYPSGHPHLQQSAGLFVTRLKALLTARDSLAIGVARHQLIVAGVATDPRNALLSDLARRLHRHRVATVRFERGIGLQEIDDLLSALAGDPKGEEGPFGLRPGAGEAWSHVKLQPPELTRMFLQEEEEDDDQAPESPGGALWLGLAHLALSADGTTTETANDPLLVARAIDLQAGQGGYDRLLLDYLGQIADEMSTRAGALEPGVRERVSELLMSLKSESLRRVLEAGASHAERRQFALMASEVLAAGAVIEVVKAAAATTGQTISDQFLRLLHKFAHHAEEGPDRGRAEAEATLRRNVLQLISEWNLEDPNPDGYTAVLDGMVRQTPGAPELAEDGGLECEPATVLQMALETGCAGPRVEEALEALVSGQRIPVAVELLRGAPPASAAIAEELWRRVATPARLRLELDTARPDLATLESLVERLGPRAIEPLFDVLERTEDRSARARALRLLAGIVPATAVAEAAAARFEDAPWFVQRNLLVLLRMVGVWPSGFSPLPYARHGDVRLRREAYKLLIEFPEHRSSAIARGLDDADPEIVTLVLRAAVDACPTEAVSALERFTGNRRRPAEQRAIAVRALGGSGGPQALHRLLDLAGVRRIFFGWRIAAKSPVVLAAVSALASHWDAHPQVAGLLKAARGHRDPEIRLAAQVRYA